MDILQFLSINLFLHYSHSYTSLGGEHQNLAEINEVYRVRTHGAENGHSLTSFFSMFSMEKRKN